MWYHIKALFTLFDRLLSFGYRRRTALFDEILQPLFQRLVAVHAYYNEMYLSTLRRIPDLSLSALILQAKPVNMPEIQRRLKAAKKRFTVLRDRDLHVRDRLRKDARDLILAVRDVEEKRFLLAVMEYFLSGGPLGASARIQDVFIASLEQAGGDQHFRSPSFFSQTALAKTDDPTEAHRILRDHVNLLNQRFTDICTAFTRLHVAITRIRT